MDNKLDKVIRLRWALHREPELSGQESVTASRIKAFIKLHNDTRILTNIGGNGLAGIYEFSNDGPVIMIRCELDALPIEESNTFEHHSVYPGISHKCGHDGHMAIVAGVVCWLKEQTFHRGKVILLFQPAEETGQGAHAVLTNTTFRDIQPDYIFALHNLPGEPLHSIILVQNRFSATVETVAIHLEGKQSHASEPEKGINPAMAVAEMIGDLAALNVTDTSDEHFALLTPVHITMGSKAYGISAGSAELHYTIRTWSEEVMKDLKAKLAAILERVAQAYSLKYRTDWFDYFPSAVNDPLCNELIRKAAVKNGLQLIEKPVPFKFGEDFGWYSKNFPSAMFGIGAGLDVPALHAVDYDFPDELIDTGIRMFARIIEVVLGGTLTDRSQWQSDVTD